jgi:hypothetical protein
MDFVPEKSALKVDKIRMGEKAMGRLPSRPSGISAGAEGVVEDADDEVPPPIATSEEKEPACVHDGWHVVDDDDYRQAVGEPQAEGMMSTAASFSLI